MLEKKVKVQYVPCKKAHVKMSCSEHMKADGSIFPVLQYSQLSVTKRSSRKDWRTNAQRGKCPYCLIRIMNTDQNNKQQREITKPKQFRVEQTLTRKIITHNSKVKSGYLSMDLNQGQRMTAASD